MFWLGGVDLLEKGEKLSAFDVCLVFANRTNHTQWECAFCLYFELTGVIPFVGTSRKHLFALKASKLI